jgi:hypothetical protein
MYLLLINNDEWTILILKTNCYFCVNTKNLTALQIWQNNIFLLSSGNSNYSTFFVALLATFKKHKI